MDKLVWHNLRYFSLLAKCMKIKIKFFPEGLPDGNGGGMKINYRRTAEVRHSQQMLVLSNQFSPSAFGVRIRRLRLATAAQNPSGEERNNNKQRALHE